MASVRLTNEIRNQIRQTAEKAFNLATPQVSLSKENAMRLVNAVKSSEMYKKLTEVRTVLNALHEQDKRAKGSAEFLGFTEVGFKDEDVGSMPVRYKSDTPNAPYNSWRVEFEPAVSLTLLHARYYSSSDVSTALLPDAEREFFDAEFSRLGKLAEERAIKRHEYESQVKGLLNGCNTFKQLVEAWPQVTAFTPEDVLNRHHAKAEPRLAETVREAVQFDSALANNIAVKAKLTGEL